ncbi:MAG: branched-chain amino acid ABC transporter permease [Thermodesulfobacteriota bacterium]|nr:branched-chain amino acid ABC transporter permease [Thermodesulfobacteriota bacterium]
MKGRPCGVFDVKYSQDKAVLRTKTHWTLFILFLIFLFTMPLYLNDHLLSLGVIIGTTVIAMFGVQIMVGYTMQITLGHAGFVGFGAYVSALLTHHLGWNFFFALPVAGLGAAMYGLLIGTSTVRCKGLYMVIPTISAHFIFFYLVNEVFKKWTFGAEGIECASPVLFGFVFDTDVSYFYLVAFIAVIMGIGAKNLVRTKTGRAFVAIRDNDISAEVMGIDIFRYKLLSFAIGNFYAGIGGALWGHYVTYINTEFFPILDTVYYVAFLIVGGLGTIMGAVFAAFFWRLLGEGVNYVAPVLDSMLSGTGGNIVSSMGLITFAVVTMLFLIFEPRGIAHRWELFKHSYRLHPFNY